MGRINRPVLLLLVLAVTAGMFPVEGMARAQGPGIEVVEFVVESRFPDGISFSVTARAPEEIEEIRVFFRKATGYQRNSTYRSLEFEPGKLVNGEYILKSSGAGHFPPGTRIEYNFEVWDKAGNVYRTPKQEFVYVDIRFDWQSKTSGLITVDYYGDEAGELAATVLEAAEEALERMGPVLGIQPTEPLRIVSYTLYQDMLPALPFRSRATREQLRTEGTAFTEERVLLVHSLDATARGTASHEFTHLLVAEATGPAQINVPSWLNEGLAEYGNVAPTSGFALALQRGIAENRIKPLWFQRTFLGSPDDIIIAYGQAGSVVGYLIAEYGEAKMALLMAAFRNRLDTDEALEKVYGFDQRKLDAQWRGALGVASLPTPEAKPRLLPETSTPEPQPAPIVEATDTPQPTASPEPTPAATVEDEAVAPGCGASLGSNYRTELATLMLLGGPLMALTWRGLRRRRYQPTAVYPVSRISSSHAGSTSPWIEGVVDSVTQQVEGQQQHRQSPHGKQQQVGVGPQYRNTGILENHQSQAGRRRLDPDS